MEQNKNLKHSIEDELKQCRESCIYFYNNWIRLDDMKLFTDIRLDIYSKLTEHYNGKLI
jgi:hypothetical protein